MSKVISFKEKRDQVIDEKRRNFERLMFQNFLGAYSVIDEAGSIYPVSLVDISKTGCLFQVPWNAQRDRKLPRESEVRLRIYFTKDSFIPVFCDVKYGNEYVDKDGKTYMRYGCEFNTETESYRALKAFIEFLYSYSELSQMDRGDQKVFFL